MLRVCGQTAYTPYSMSTKTYPAMESHVQPIKHDNPVVMECPCVEAEGGLQETIVDPPEQESVPVISLNWTLDPTSHSFSSELPPTLCLILTSHADKPITIYNETLNPSRLLCEGKFPIFDQTDSIEVPHHKRIYCDFEPPSKIKVPLREKLFQTLYPEMPLVLATPFGPTDWPPKPFSEGYVKPGVEFSTRRALGVDGLKPGHHYSLRARKGWGQIRWWEYGEKEEVMNPPTGKLDGRKVAYRRSKNPHPPIMLDVKNVQDIDFWCVE